MQLFRKGQVDQSAGGEGGQGGKGREYKTFKEFILVLIFIYLHFSLKCEVKIVSQLVMDHNLSSFVISMWYSINQVIVVLQTSQ